jgi:peptidoglycan/LPS O-acetylase OafA/YrhL
MRSAAVAVSNVGPPVAAPAAARRAVRQRDDGLDFTKGVLILLIVVYHWCNYFVETRWDIYRFLRFLTPSFIFISGYIVAFIYPARHGVGPRVSRRLFQRGLKLLALFTVLNLCAAALLPAAGRASGVRGFVLSAYDVFVTGNGRALFDVLVPIGYFLLLAPIALQLTRRVPKAVVGLALVFLGAATAASLRGQPIANLEMVSLGLLGMAVGATPPREVGGVFRHPAVLAASYLLYVAAIVTWNVLFPLQIVGVCLSVLAIDLAGRRVGFGGVWQPTIIELGQYSLFAYIGQVMILQVLRRGLGPAAVDSAVGVVAFAVAVVLVIGSVKVTAALRRRSAIADGVYRAVFA